MAATPSTTRSGQALAHPLDPLSGEEIERTVAVLREQRGLGERARFVEIVLREPGKDDLARFEAGETIPREAAAVVLDNAATHEAVVALDNGDVAVMGHDPRRPGGDHARRVRRV